MAMFNFYLASCALMMLLLAADWRTATGLPVRALSAERCAQCSQLYRSLLLNITGLLENENVCFSINVDAAVVKSNTDTVQACAPDLTQNPGCMMQRNSSFSKTGCLRNIRRDLAHYAAVFQSYLSSPLRCPEKEVPLLNATLGVIQNLRETCSLMPNGENDSLEDNTAQMWGDDTFTNRQEMCKMIKGFYARTITINRAMGYIYSGDHQK